MLRSMTTHSGTSIDLFALYQRAGAATRTLVGVSRLMLGWRHPAARWNSGRWSRTPVSSHYSADAQCNGETIVWLGRRFEGYVFGDDPLSAYKGSLASAQAAF